MKIEEKESLLTNKVKTMNAEKSKFFVVDLAGSTVYKLSEETIQELVNEDNSKHQRYLAFTSPDTAMIALKMCKIFHSFKLSELMYSSDCDVQQFDQDLDRFLAQLESSNE